MAKHVVLFGGRVQDAKYLGHYLKTDHNVNATVRGITGPTGITREHAKANAAVFDVATPQILKLYLDELASHCPEGIPPTVALVTSLGSSKKADVERQWRGRLRVIPSFAIEEGGNDLKLLASEIKKHAKL